MSDALKPLELSEEYIAEFFERQNISQFKLSDMRDDFVKFCKFMVGFPVRDYQAYITDMFNNNQKVGIVKGRQIGFSTVIALYCLWYGWFKKAKTGALQNTKILVISKDDQAAKDLLQLIKDFMYMGDKHMSNFLKGRKEHSTHIFTQEITQSNVDMLKLKNGTEIRSYPSTDKVRGKSADILFIDEFAFLNCPDVQKFYYETCAPTISETQGKVIISSTPNGFGGLFYDLIDPEGKNEKHEFNRVSVPFTVNKRNPGYMAMVEDIMNNVEESKFQQEFLCSFESGDVNFFIGRKVKEMFDDTVLQMDMDEHEYICGIDYGMTEARTVVTLCTKKDGVIYRPYFKEFESGYDINGLIPFLEGLKDRFTINKFVVDDCAQGDMINKKMIELGWNVMLFDFKKVKIEGYCSFRNKLNNGLIKTAPSKSTEKQMIEMIQEESKMGKLMIHKRRSGRDDIVDSFIMAAYPLMEAGDKMEVFLI